MYFFCKSLLLRSEVRVFYWANGEEKLATMIDIKAETQYQY